MRDRSLPELTGMGTWLMPKGVGCCRPWPLAPDGASSNLLPRLGLRLALGIRVDPVDLRLPAQLLREEVIDGPGLLHAIQRLDVRGSGGPRGVAVRASARLGAAAQQVRGSVDSCLDRPSRADHQFPCRCARSAGHRQGALAQGGQSSARFHGRRRLGFAAATSAAEAKPSVASASATCCEAKRSMSCTAWRSTSAALWPARSNKGSTSLGLPMIWWGAGTSSGGGASPGGRLGMRSVRSSQSPPPRSTFMVWFSDTLLTAAAAPATPPATIASAA